MLLTEPDFLSSLCLICLVGRVVVGNLPRVIKVELSFVTAPVNLSKRCVSNMIFCETQALQNRYLGFWKDLNLAHHVWTRSEQRLREDKSKAEGLW